MKSINISVKTLLLIIFVSLITIVNTTAQNATVSIDRNWGIRTIPDDLYGFNGQIWDGNQNGSNTSYNNLLKNAGIKVMRWPGGSWGDVIKWDNTTCYQSWAVTYAQSKALYSSLGIRFQPIVNFSGMFCYVQQTPVYADSIAVNWVADSALGAKYWEVGNETMGPWEEGNTNDTTYGKRFADFYTAMKAKNSNINIIAVGDPNDVDDQYHPGTGVWNRKVMEAALKKGVVPDGFQIHTYPSDEYFNLLHHDLDEIGIYTNSLNQMVSSETGKGQLDYCMTEFSASDSEQYVKMLGAQFSLQYFMEMAKYNWAVANIWGQIYNTTTFRAAPVWYVYAFLNGKFGHKMVNDTSNNADVRSYASVDTTGNLTIWVCNNSADSSTIKLNLSNFKPSAKGEIWIMEGDSANDGNCYDIKINGEVHPNEANARFMPGDTIDVDTSFVIKLPGISFALVKLSPASIDSCVSTDITPRMKINSGDWESNIYATVPLGTNLVLSPTANGTGIWKWSGPNNFVDSVAEINLDSIQASGSGQYIVSYTNACGITSKLGFNITATNCVPTDVTPYIQVDNNAWQSNTNATVPAGSNVSFGPQPFSGSWSWSGPNGFTSNQRQITIPKIQISGTYTLTYTNACGAITLQNYQVTVIPTGLSSLEISRKINIYPNPSRDGIFKIESSEGLENLNVSIFNLQGAQVFSQTNIVNGVSINTGLHSGVYILKLGINNNSVFRKLVIEQ